jgi:phospholipid/cholesterol/gamma-HCH transport system substrate-binding protein
MSAAVRHRLLGLTAVGVLVALGLLTVLAFRQTFTPVVMAQVETERAGLLMAEGSDVTLRGIVVGKVRDVRSDGPNAVLDVAFDPAMTDLVPASVTASIAAPTVFGAKYIQLDAPANPGAARIAEGAVLRAGAVSTEANTVLGGLNTLLTHVDVAQLNSGLGALSTTLNGRGRQLGDLAVQLNRFLTDFNPHLPALQKDAAAGADVANTLADAAPDLLRVLDNLSTTSGTFVDEQPALDTLLTDLTQVANDSRTLLADNEAPLGEALHTLRPTSGFLGRYSAMFPCLFASVNQLRKDFEPVVGGDYPGIHTFTSFLPGSAGYTEADLPKTAENVSPSCAGGPVNLDPSSPAYPHVNFDDGTAVFDKRDDSLTVGDPLPVVLFGEAGRGSGR